MRREDQCWIDWAYEYYEEHVDDVLRRAVQDALRSRQDPREDSLLSDVALARLPSLLRNYDPERSTNLDGYVYQSVKWWVYKALQAGDTQPASWNDAWNEIFASSIERPDSNVVAEEIERLRNRLTTREYMLIVRRYGEDWTLQELADKAHCSVASISHRLGQAMAKARKELL